MKALFIGGTGNISSAISKIAIEKGIEIHHLNRGNSEPIEGAFLHMGDIAHIDKSHDIIKNHRWDVIVNWIAFTPDDVTRDYHLFKGITNQYIFISSASAYQKPPLSPVITESTPLVNPFWDYSRNKAACEDKLMQFHREDQFPITIVRPSHTYNTVIPISLGGWTEYTTVDRMKKGLPVIVHGDGTSLWTITHADDFAVGFIGLLNNPKAIGEAFHITSDEAMTWNYIYKMVGRAVGVDPDLVHIASETIVSFAEKNNGPDVRGTLLGDKSFSAIFDNSKIKRIVPEFNCVIPFHKGIKKTIEWFEESKERMVIHPSTNHFFDQLINSYNSID